jgi:purine-cytosine permease-like protein
MQTPWTRRVWPWVFVAHAVFVVLLIALYAVLMATTGPGEGVNFGAIFVVLALLGLGLPWSAPVVTADPSRFEDASEAFFAAAHFGPAVANVVLHGLVLLVATRRKSRRGRIAPSL